jgi:hypothetical protein
MSSNNSSLASVLAELADGIAATLASLWPRSAAALEAGRLVADGYPAGEVCDVHFLVSFDEATPDAALTAIRAGGFAIREQGDPVRGFITVRRQVRLGAYQLSLAGARLDRIAAGFGGFATVICATPPTNDDVARAVVSSRRSISPVSPAA